MLFECCFATPTATKHMQSEVWSKREGESGGGERERREREREGGGEERERERERGERGGERSKMALNGYQVDQLNIQTLKQNPRVPHILTKTAQQSLRMQYAIQCKCLSSQASI